MNTFNGFGLVIKTDSYAGNFERELCAHVTGHIGECEVGNKFVEKDITNMFMDYIVSLADDHGCYRPVEIYDDNDGYNSLVIYFSVEPTPEQINIIKQRVETFNENYLKKDGFYSKYPDNYKPVKVLGYKLIKFNSTKEIINENI